MDTRPRGSALREAPLARTRSPPAAAAGSVGETRDWNPSRFRRTTRRAASMARCISAFDASATSPSDVLVGRVDVGERARFSVDELAVDHHLRFETDSWSFRHASRFRGSVKAPYRGMPIITRITWCIPAVGRTLLMIRSIRASGPTGRRANGLVPSRALARPVGEPVRRLCAVAHREPAARVHRGVVAGVRARRSRGYRSCRRR